METLWHGLLVLAVLVLPLLLAWLLIAHGVRAHLPHPPHQHEKMKR
ncbi:MAG: hypothetical protein WC760_14605 [Bacteroidia bacterium]|jgi:hypothetical protein